MKWHILIICLGVVAAHADVSRVGLLHIKSAHTVADTVLRLEKSFINQSFTSESRLNAAHWGTALELQIRPTWLLLLNHPQMGALMPCGRTVALDLPLKALVWEDEAGQTWISYNDLRYLQARHGLDRCLQTLNELAKKFEDSALEAASESLTPPGASSNPQPPNTEAIPDKKRR